MDKSESAEPLYRYVFNMPHKEAIHLGIKGSESLK